MITDPETFYPRNSREWRNWLDANHHKRQSIWLIYGKKTCSSPTLTWSEAVDEALCFGWIDSTRKSLDEHHFMQYFCRRKPGSGWSAVNKRKVQQIIEKKLMRPAGYASIEAAKQNGSWSMFDEVEALTVPEDLEKEFESRPGSAEFFLSLSRSVRKSILHWLILARRPETRQKRLKEIAEQAARKLKPAHL